MAEGDDIDVHVTVPTDDTPEPETTDVVVVNNEADNDGDAVDAAVISEVVEQARETERVHAELTDVAEQTAEAQQTADVALETATVSAENTSQEVAALSEQIAELEEELSAPDTAPNNSHWWFRPRHEWKER